MGGTSAMLKRHVARLVYHLGVAGFICAILAVGLAGCNRGTGDQTGKTVPEDGGAPAPSTGESPSEEPDEAPQADSTEAATCTHREEITKFKHAEDAVGTISVVDLMHNDTPAVAFASQMAVNTDGASDSYHPENIGITHICNGVSVGPSFTWKANCLADFNQAKAEGFRGPTKIRFFAMVTDDDGVPVVQQKGVPKPGYFVSTTTFTQPGVSKNTQQAYLDSNEIPFVVIPSQWQRNKFQGVQLGDFAVVVRKTTGDMSFAVVGDLGPRTKLGEGSVALHQALGNDPFVKRPDGNIRAWIGISPHDVVYVIFPGSRKSGKLMTRALIDQEGRTHLARFGGEARLRACAETL